MKYKFNLNDRAFLAIKNRTKRLNKTNETRSKKTDEFWN